jgi:hypothetical protein
MIVTPHRANLAIACPLTLVLAQADGGQKYHGHDVRRTPRQALGIISHAVVLGAASAAVAGASVDSAWLVAAWKEAAAPFADTIELHRDLHMVKARTRRRALQICDLAQDWSAVTSDQWFQSPDGRWGGRPDLIVDDGREVYEYKTGAAVDAGRLRRDVERQVQLYAGLLTDVFERDVERAAVLTLDGALIDVDVSPATVSAARSEVPRALDGAAARPGEACRWCPYRPRCSTYIATWDVEVGRRDGTLAGVVEATRVAVQAADGATYQISGVSLPDVGTQVLIDELQPARGTRWRGTPASTAHRI